MSTTTIFQKLKNRLYFWLLRRKNAGKSAQEIFSEYWTNNHWRNIESRSGDGSTIAYTENIRAEIPRLLDRLNAQSILDAPCGDFNWFKEIQLAPSVKYIGGDIVADLIGELNREHASSQRRFVRLDVTADKLPAVDLWLCRDLIFHLPTSDVINLLHNFASSNIKYILITSHSAQNIDNTDTFMGGFRMINLENPPFYLPIPEARVRDYIDGFPERHLLLYRREELQAWAIRRKK